MEDRLLSISLSPAVIGLCDSTGGGALVEGCTPGYWGWRSLGVDAWAFAVVPCMGSFGTASVTAVAAFFGGGERGISPADLVGRAFPGRSAIGCGKDLAGREGHFAFAVDGPGVAARAFDGRGFAAFAGEGARDDGP